MRRFKSALALILLLGQLSSAAPKTYQLRELLEKSYLELLDIAPQVSFSEREVAELKKQLDRELESEKKRLEREEEQLKRQIEAARRQLNELNKGASRDTEEMTERRRKLHCQILKLEREMLQKKAEREHGLPIAYENKRAKLDLIQSWPAKKREIEQAIAEGRARQRPFGDVEDIGIRKVGEGQEKDIPAGEDAIRQLKAYGLMPPELEDKELKSYLQKLADLIAANSDLKIPVRVTLLSSEEINAFALPGGFLFINSGLLQKAETESELVGVMAHEIAHVAARHSARLMKRATIANIIYQIAQVAAILFTGGVASAAAYYALEYGFFGLGLALDLALLGVSREYEAEADRLGVQYAWKSGYDPRGFITFFDKMASEKGYVRSTSFFRTHPPFFDRIVATFSEIEYLPPKADLKVDSTEFQEMKKRLAQVLEENKREEAKQPRLRRMPQCDQE